MNRLEKLVICLLVIVPAWPGTGGGALAADADHLIFGEVVLKARPPYSLFGSPYIEIINPTDSPLEMDRVHLTDGNYSPSAFYYYLPLADLQEHNPGGGNGGDFHARFPDGYVLAAGDTLAVSINGSAEYLAAYGRLPDFELYEDAVALDDIPELVEVFPGSIGAGPFGGDNVPGLSDIAESLILYLWDGDSDLVQDLDYVLWGALESVRVDKTGVVIGDGAYLPDTPVDLQEPVAAAGHNFREALRRVSADEGMETPSGGNGWSGHDETSENLATTWQVVDVGVTGHGVPAAPAVWHPAAPVVLGVSRIPAEPYEGQSVELAATLASPGAITSADFYYRLDGGPFLQVPGVTGGDDVYSALIPAQVEGRLVEWYCRVLNDGGGQVVYPSGAPDYLGSWTVQQPPPANEIPKKLLISEVCTLGTPDEFIEIHNPNDFDVDLTNYYLADAIYLDQGYWNMGAGPDQYNVGGGIYFDFTARFPLGLVLPAGENLVISMQGNQSFLSVYGFNPDLEMFEDGLQPDTIPDMRPVFETADGNSIVTLEGSLVSEPSLNNLGESLVLFHWVEGHDLVTDIDIFLWGAGGPYTIDKTGRTVGGSTYLPDQPAPPFATIPDYGWSYNRVDLAEGDQLTSGSNGVDGRDETSENFAATFEIQLRNPEPGPGIFPVEGDWQDVWLGEVWPVEPRGHSWADLAGGGLESLFVLDSAPDVPHQVYAGANGLYLAQPLPSGIEPSVTDRMGIWADAENDGDLDLFMARDFAENILFWSDPAFGYFGWPYGGMLEPNASVNAAWVDLDRDGMLEIYVANKSSAAQLLYGRYGFYDQAPPELQFPDGCIGFAWCDHDRDFDDDLAVLTSGGRLHLLEQGADGHFTTTVHDLGGEPTRCAWGDFDNDQDFDLVVTLSDQPNLLFHNLGAEGFTPTPLPQVGGPHDSRQAAWGDFDNDGFLDLYVGNAGAPNLLLRNDGGSGDFLPVDDEDVSSLVDCVDLSWKDIDQDGDLDLFVCGLPNHQLLRNNLDNENHHLQVILEGLSLGTQSNRDAIGALVRVKTGDRIQWRQVPGDGSARTLHFGLGDAAVVDELTVYWPFELMDGQWHTYQEWDVAADQIIPIGEPWLGMSGAEDGTPARTPVLHACHPNPFNPATTISFSLPRAGAVALEVFDLAGRRVRTLLQDEKLEPGDHEVVWRGRDAGGRGVASGVYHVRLRAEGVSQVQRVSLVR